MRLKTMDVFVLGAPQDQSIDLLDCSRRSRRSAALGGELLCFELFTGGRHSFYWPGHC
jgi:hypothetical protein